MDQSSRPRDDLVAMKQEQGKGNWQHESSPSRSNYNTAMIGSEDLMLIIGGSVKMWVAISDDGVWFREKLLSDEAISGKLTAKSSFRYFKPQIASVDSGYRPDLLEPFQHAFFIISLVTCASAGKR